MASKTQFSETYLKSLLVGVPITLWPRRDIDINRQLAVEISKTPVLEDLPAILWPSKTSKMKPPKMLFGFPSPRDALFQYAKDHDLLLHSDPMDEEGQIAFLSDLITVPRRKGEVDVTASVSRAFHHIARELGLQRPHHGLTPAMALNHDGPAHMIICLYSNYDGRNAIPADQVSKLVEFYATLGVAVEPKWYVSADLFYWRQVKAW